MPKVSGNVFLYNTTEEDTKQQFASTQDVLLGTISWGVRNVLQYCINRIDLLQYTESNENLFYHYDVETKMANSYTEGSYRSATYEVTAIIELTNEKGDLVSGHRSVICRVSFDGNDVSMDNLVSLNHRVERFVNEVVKHLSQ
nr:MAG TPA: hypothetical protein [Caudoviricetes sp.]